MLRLFVLKINKWFPSQSLKKERLKKKAVVIMLYRLKEVSRKYMKRPHFL